MADPASHSNADDDARAGADRDGSPRMPRWVKVFGVTVAVLVVLLIAMLILGGHGPGRHTASDGDGGHATLAGVTTVDGELGQGASPEGGL